MSHLMVRGKALAGQTHERGMAEGGTAKGTLLLSVMRLTNVREEPGVGCAAVGKMHAGFIQAEGAVHGEADIAGVCVLLAIVFPPANRT